MDPMMMAIGESSIINIEIFKIRTLKLTQDFPTNDFRIQIPQIQNPTLQENLEICDNFYDFFSEIENFSRGICEERRLFTHKNKWLFSRENGNIK